MGGWECHHADKKLRHVDRCVVGAERAQEVVSCREAKGSRPLGHLGWWEEKISGNRGKKEKQACSSAVLWSHHRAVKTVGRRR